MLTNSEKEQKDEEIVLKVQSGQIDYFELLVLRYEEKIKRYGKKFLSGYEDIEDIVQQIFLKAYINIQSFDPSRKFSSWLYRIAHNEFINAIKKKKKEPLPFFDPDVILPHPLSKEPADKGILQYEAKNIINNCLNKLNPKYREVIVLYYFEDMGYKDISDILHIPVSTIGVRIKRAKNIMKKLCQTEL
jgi:RNA polymerase sigma-70 factor, ECF subfamily